MVISGIGLLLEGRVDVAVVAPEGEPLERPCLRPHLDSLTPGLGKVLVGKGDGVEEDLVLGFDPEECQIGLDPDP